MADPLRVLYVDDEVPLLEIGKLYLERNGDISIDTAVSAIAALALLEKNPYDCIVSDYLMPKMDGITFLKSVRAAYGDLPFILFTGKGREEIIINAINNGADFYLQKGGDAPPLYAELVHKIRQAVMKRRAIDDLRAAYDRIAASEEGLRQQLAEREKNQEALKKSEEKFRTLVENSLDGIIIISFSGTILFANKAVGEMIHAPDYRASIGSANVVDFAAPSSRPAMLQDIGRVRQGDEAYLVHYTLVTADRQEIRVECIGRRISYENEPAMLISVRDITSRVLAEDALRKANEKLNILSSITRHDISNSLLGLNAFIALAEDEARDCPAALEMLGKARAQAKRIEEQIWFTKDYQDLGIKQPVWQNIAAIVRMAAYENLPVDIQLNVLTGNYEIFADPMFMLVCFNLLDNAKRHGQKVSTISVTFADQESGGVLTVTDDGIGIPRDQKDLIFEKNFGKHTGLGLFLSREILAITDIAIRETGMPGQGARFEIHLPPGRYRLAGEPAR